MTVKLFSALLNRIRPYVPGCPTPVVLEHINLSARRVCEKTLAYRYETGLYNLSPGVHEYAFNCPVDTEVHGMFGFTINEYPLCQVTLDDAIRLYPEWANLYSGESAATLWSETASGSLGSHTFNEEDINGGADFTLPDSVVAEGSTPAVYCMISPQRYIVLPLPDEQTYTARQFLALKPTKAATSMEEQFLDELEDPIVYRTIEELCLIPGAPWSNPQQAAAFAVKYGHASTEKRARANIGHVRGSMSVRMRRW